LLFSLALFVTYKKVFYKPAITKNSNAVNNAKNSETTTVPEKTTETEYSTVLTDATGRMTYKFPNGAFGDYKGNIQTWPGRHKHDFDQNYRFIMDSMLVIGDIKQSTDFKFLKPVEITAKYDEQYLTHLDRTEITFLFTKDATGTTRNPWTTLSTQLDPQHYTASTTGEQAGNYVLVAPLLCPEDTSEFDDNYDSSRTIGEVGATYYDGPGTAPRIIGTPFGQKISRIFDVKQDEEWFHFEARKGTTYIMETSDLAQGVKPLIIIYDTDGVTQVTSNPLRLEWKPDDRYFQYGDAKTFFIGVNAQPDSLTGCTAKFNFTLSEK